MRPYDTAVLNRQGGRESNQDRADFYLHGDSGCWVVADGLGGHQGGETAARITVEKVLETFRGRPEMASETILAGFKAAQRQIVRLQEEEVRLYGMRTTCVVLLADAGQALWGHLGDSRLYRFQKGRLVFQSRDHSVTQALTDAGEIRPEDMRHDENRNRLTRVLGKEDLAQPTIEQARGLAADEAFLLCTDGFWEYVEEAEMEIDLAKAGTPDDWLRFMETRLRARAKGEFDNYTAVAVFCHTGRGAATLSPLPVVRQQGEPAPTTAVPMAAHVASAQAKKFPWTQAVLVFVATVAIGIGLVWWLMKPSNQPPVAKADPAQAGEGQQAAGTDRVVTDPAATGPENRHPEAVDDADAGRTRTEESVEVVDLDSDRGPVGGSRAAARNQIPIATPDHGVARAGQPITIAVLENDADVNPDDELTVVFVGEPEYGTAVPNSDGTITYTPKEGHEGLDEFTYRVTDGHEEAETTVRVEVLPSNILLAQDDTRQTRAGQEVIIPVLLNDQVPAGTSLSITTRPRRGTVRKNDDGTVTYQPNPTFRQGRDELTYTVAHGTQTATATVAIQVKPSRAPSTPTAPRSGEVRIHRKDGLAYAWIPPAQEGQTGFWIGQTEVTVRAFKKHVPEAYMPRQPKGNGDDHPVVSVNWNKAKGFCEWSGGRLPTALDWEHAARGGLEDPTYPWGNQEPSCSRQDPNGSAGRPRTCKLNGMVEVGSYQVNGYKLYDMAGNAAEWCQDPLTGGDKRVVHGGSFRDKEDLRIAERASAKARRTFVFIGFRCLREDPPAE